MTNLLCMSRYGQKLDKSPFQKNQSFHDFYFQISLSHSFQTEESLRSSYLVLTLALTLTKNFMYLLNISDFIFSTSSKQKELKYFRQFATMMMMLVLVTQIVFCSVLRLKDQCQCSISPGHSTITVSSTSINRRQSVPDLRCMISRTHTRDMGMGCHMGSLIRIQDEV